MEKKVAISIKDIIYIFGIVLTVSGSWHTQTSRVREVELMLERHKAINDLTIQQLNKDLLNLNTQVDALAKKKQK